MTEERRRSMSGGLPSQPRSVEQLGILVLDGSGSMDDLVSEKDPGSGRKADAVGKAVEGLVARLQKGTRRQDFLLSLIVFDENVEVRLQPTPVTDIDTATVNCNPYMGGKTAIGEALSRAAEVAEDFLAGQMNLPRSVVIMLMSDGMNIEGRDPLQTADGIKTKWGTKVKIVSVAYGHDADSGTLRKVASNPEVDFVATDSAEQLRSFFERSMVAGDRPA